MITFGFVEPVLECLIGGWVEQSEAQQPSDEVGLRHEAQQKGNVI